MKPRVIFLEENGKTVKISKEKLLELLDEFYQQGYSAGYDAGKQVSTFKYENPYWYREDWWRYPYVTCDGTITSTSTTPSDSFTITATSNGAETLSTIDLGTSGKEITLDDETTLTKSSTSNNSTKEDEDKVCEDLLLELFGLLVNDKEEDE